MKPVFPHGRRLKTASRYRRSGEWTRAGYRAPACYTTNQTPTARGTFSVAPADLPTVTLFAETDAAIGGFAATNVAFAGGAASDVALSTKSATTNCILKETFDLTWKAVVSNGTEVVTNTLGKTDGHVLYTILGEPVEPWNNNQITNQNDWAFALDFLITNKCEGASTDVSVLKRLTFFFFTEHGLVYDTISGSRCYLGDLSTGDNVFNLSGYYAKSSGNIVNCYDQASGLAMSARMLGVQADIVYMIPFGYINETELLGLGRSNNPFYSNPAYDARIVCPTNENDRSGFGNHMFVSHVSGCFDSCAGPVMGQWNLAEYISHVIDTTTTNTLFRAGTISDAFIYPFVVENQ